MSPKEFGLTLALFPSPPTTLPSSHPMAHGTTTTTSSRPELAVYYFNSPTALPNQKKPIPLARPTSLVIVDNNESNLNSEKGNKQQQKSPRKMRSSLFHAFSSTSSPVTVAVAAPASSPKADGITGLRDGDIASITSPTSPVNDNANSAGNSISQPESADTFRVVSRPVRQRVAQSSTAPDTTASARSVQVECTSPTTSSSSAPSPSSTPSSKSPFKKRRRVVKTTRQSSPLRNPPILPSDLPSRPPSPPPTAPAPAPKKKSTAVSKRKPTVWEKRPLVQKVLLKEFERTPHGAEILRRGAKPGIAFLEEQKSQNSTTTKSGRKSGSDEENAVVVVSSKPRSKDVSAMRHWGRIVKTALAGPLKEMAGPMAGDGRPPMPMIRAW